MRLGVQGEGWTGSGNHGVKLWGRVCESSRSNSGLDVGVRRRADQEDSKIFWPEMLWNETGTVSGRTCLRRQSKSSALVILCEVWSWGGETEEVFRGEGESNRRHSVGVTMNRRRAPPGSRYRQDKEEFRNEEDPAKEPEKEGAMGQKEHRRA